LTIAPGKLLTANDSVQYTIPNQPDAACTQIPSAFQSSAGKIVVNGTTVKDVGGNINMTQVKCASDSNTIDLYMS
jgi:PilS N terminal